MSTSDIDLRRLACPEPVVRARKAMLEPGATLVRVLLDRGVSVENIERMAESLGWTAVRETLGDDVRLTLTKGVAAAGEEKGTGAPPSPRAVVLVGAEGIGTGDETLGRILMRAFLKTLKDLEPPPAAMIFVNAGVHLTTAGSPLLDDIRALENRGTRVLSCGTCLDYFHKLDALKVGSVSNMYEIASALLTADRVVRP